MSSDHPNIPLNPGLLVGKYMYTYLHIFMTQGIPYLLHQKKRRLAYSHLKASQSPWDIKKRCVFLFEMDWAHLTWLAFLHATQQNNPSTFNCTPRKKHPKNFCHSKRRCFKNAQPFKNKPWFPLGVQKSGRTIHCPIGTFHNETKFRLPVMNPRPQYQRITKKNRWLNPSIPLKPLSRCFKTTTEKRDIHS